MDPVQQDEVGIRGVDPEDVERLAAGVDDLESLVGDPVDADVPELQVLPGGDVHVRRPGVGDVRVGIVAVVAGKAVGAVAVSVGILTVDLDGDRQRGGRRRERRDGCAGERILQRLARKQREVETVERVALTEVRIHERGAPVRAGFFLPRPCDHSPVEDGARLSRRGGVEADVHADRLAILDPQRGLLRRRHAQSADPGTGQSQRVDRVDAGLRHRRHLRLVQVGRVQLLRCVEVVRRPGDRDRTQDVRVVVAHSHATRRGQRHVAAVEHDRMLQANRVAQLVLGDELGQRLVDRQRGLDREDPQGPRPLVGRHRDGIEERLSGSPRKPNVADDDQHVDLGEVDIRIDLLDHLRVQVLNITSRHVGDLRPIPVRGDERELAVGILRPEIRGRIDDLSDLGQFIGGSRFPLVLGQHDERVLGPGRQARRNVSGRVLLLELDHREAPIVDRRSEGGDASARGLVECRAL